ncbi:MAG: hypothetical protein B6229_04670 [Spirochaetaceae bacterium 4572_7]|nr:MAG: hypothetical protein B6229_04670 [Spirochaetaceae bacterium 4572_7]
MSITAATQVFCTAVKASVTMFTEEQKTKRSEIGLQIAQEQEKSARLDSVCDTIKKPFEVVGQIGAEGFKTVGTVGVAGMEATVQIGVVGFEAAGKVGVAGMDAVGKIGVVGVEAAGKVGVAGFDATGEIVVAGMGLMKNGLDSLTDLTKTCVKEINLAVFESKKVNQQHSLDVLNAENDFALKNRAYDLEEFKIKAELMREYLNRETEVIAIRAESINKVIELTNKIYTDIINSLTDRSKQLLQCKTKSEGNEWKQYLELEKNNKKTLNEIIDKYESLIKYLTQKVSFLELKREDKSKEYQKLISVPGENV